LCRLACDIYAAPLSIMKAMNRSMIPGTITFLTGVLAGKSYQLTKPIIYLGSGYSNNIVIPDSSVAYHHVCMTWDTGTWKIKKLSPQFALTINKQDGQEASLKDSDMIGLGEGTTFLFSINVVSQARISNQTSAPRQGSRNPITPPPVDMNSSPAVVIMPTAVVPRTTDMKSQKPDMRSLPTVIVPPMTAAPQKYDMTPQATVAPQKADIRSLPTITIPSMAATPQTYDITPPTVEEIQTVVTPQKTDITSLPTIIMSPMVATPQKADITPPMAVNSQIANIASPTVIMPQKIDITPQTVDASQSAAVIPPKIAMRSRTPVTSPKVAVPSDKDIASADQASQNNATRIVVARPVPQHLQPDLSGPLSSPPPDRSLSIEVKLMPVTNLVNYGDTQAFPRLSKEPVLDNDELDDNIMLIDDGMDTPGSLPEIRPIPLGPLVITIGRAPDNVVVLNHPQVSAHHARLDRTEQGYCIIDHGSTNHVYVNEQNVTYRVLVPGDEIRIGPFKLIYTDTQLIQHNESRGVRIDAVGLYKEGYKGQVLLHDISLTISASKFVALVGGSGAGKSMLMDALNGLRPAQRGTVFYNGQNYYRHPAAFKTQLGYVPQDNIIHNDLTVERVLYYAARLRLPSDFTREQINERIKAVLDDMEITEQRKLMVHKLSGGQRKRVSIALELLANPSVFFLDEPTSGLDPGLDRKMMLLLRKLADKGHTVVLVTHATNHINVCDYVCFIARGGRLAYYGTPDGARSHFGKSDFAEIYSDLEPTKENPNIPAEVEARFRESPRFKRYLKTIRNKASTNRSNVREANNDENTVAEKMPRFGNPWLQFFILVTRYLELLKNDKPNLALLLLQAPIIGILLFLLASSTTFDQSNILVCPHRVNIMSNTGPISNDCQQELQALNALTSRQGLAFKAQRFPGKSDLQIVQDSITTGSGSSSQKILLIIVLAAVMSGCTDGAREIVKEAPIYRRERTVNLGIIPYMFSKFAVLGLLCLLQSFMLVLLISFKAPFSHSILLPPFLEIYISAALASLAGLMIGLTISAVVPNSDRALSVVPIVIVPQIIFSNVLFSLDNPPFLQVLGGIFPARWAMAAMGSTVGLHGDKLRTDGFSYRSTLLSLTSQSEAVFHLLLCWFVLVLMIVLLGLTIAILLKKKDVRA